MKELIKTVQDLIRLESTNPGKGERSVAEYIKNYLGDCGAELIEDPVFPGRNNVIATIGGEIKAPMLVLICHMDTVVVGADWTRDPFAAETEENRIYGRGACDMKSGFACALSVFRETAEKYQKGEISLDRPLRLIGTVDEEGNMEGVENAIRKGRVTADDWVMDLEPTDGQIQMAHKGRFWLEVSVQGITAHASRPEQGADAIAAAAQWICSMRKAFGELPVHQELGRSTITFGQIQGGYQPYVVPDLCRLWVDCRLAPPVNDLMVQSMADRAIKEAEQEISGVKISYKITGNRPYIEKNPDSGLLKEIKRAVHTVTGKEAEVCPFPGYTDTAVIAGRLQNRNCLSYGPGNLKYAHKPDEFVETEDIERCHKVLQELLEGCVCKKIQSSY